MSPILNKILRSAASYWSVPEPYLIVPIHYLERVIITTALLDRKTRALVEMNTDLFKPGNFKHKAKCCSHPCSALIGERPLMDEVGFVKTWTETQSLNKAMEEATQKHLLNPLLKKYGHLLMRFTVDFCTLWAIQPPIMLDGWKFNLLRQPRYFLYADVNFHRIRDVISFQEVIELIPKTKRSRFPSAGFNFRPPTSTKRRPSLDQKIQRAIKMELEKNGVENEKDIEEAFMAVEEAILFDLEAEMENRTESSENSFHPKKSFQYRSASPGDSRFYQCSVPTSTALGAGDVEFLVKESLKCAFNQDYEYWSEAAAVLISSAVWHPIDELQTLGIRFRFAYSTITPRTPPPALEMYADVGSEFYRVIPPNLVPLYSKLSLHGFPSKESVNRYLKQLRPWFTCSRLQQSLLNVCPTVWNYPPVLPILGFYPINEKSPALRSYCRVDARMISRSHRWVQFFDPAYDADSLHWSIGFRPCGSPNVPQVCELREFAAMIRSLLSQALPADTIDAINTLNAISAGLHLFGNVLMGGVRNWRMLIPDIASSGWIGYQKCHYLFHPPSFISEIIPLYEQRREEFCNRALEKGEKVDLIGIVNASLCLLKHDKKRVISPIEFTSSAIAMALLLCPATFRWKRLYSGALRHFSMSELYSAGFQSNDIEWFHHRSLSALHPFRSHRLEPVINPSLRAEMESHLRRVLEL